MPHREDAYWSRIEEINGDTITIAAPMKESLPIWIARGTKIRVDIPYEGKRYSFYATVLQVSEGDLSTWTITYPDKLETINLRAFFRLDVSLDAAVKLDEEDARWCKCMVTNLSGNGALLSIKKDFPAEVDAEVVLRLALPDEDVMELVGKVVRRSEVPSAPDLVQLALHFPDITSFAQDRIMKYLFEQQRKLRQRGLL